MLNHSKTQRRPRHANYGRKARTMPFREKFARRFGDSVWDLVLSVIAPHADILQLSPGPSPNQPYLSLTYEDVKALRHDWLTDNNIAFWEEFLEREVLTKYPQAHIVLLRPSMTFLLMKDSDTEAVKSAIPDFRGVTHIFLPINDNRNVSQAEGGSHWSLLLVSIIDGVAFHYDSLEGANNDEALLCLRRLEPVLRKKLRFHHLSECPQQDNGSDCGVFVCIIMRHLLVKRLLAVNAGEKISMSMAHKAIDAVGARKEMINIVNSLRKEGERRRSSSHSNTPPRVD
ncbi:Ulp1 protease family protein [Seiridium cupressi]